jgi:hypothetical protein
MKPFEKKLLKKWFSPQISSKPPSPQEMEQKKEEKEKLQEPLQIKGKLTFWEEKDASISKIIFDVTPFSPPPSYHFKKHFSKIMEKVFLTHFGPSFSLAIYMAWVVPFSFTQELHIFSF